MKQYLINLAMAFDQMIGAIFGGDPDETISSRLGKNPRGWSARILCPLLNLIDKNHCKDAIEKDEGKDETFKI